MFKNTSYYNLFQHKIKEICDELSANGEEHLNKNNYMKYIMLAFRELPRQEQLEIMYEICLPACTISIVEKTFNDSEVGRYFSEMEIISSELEKISCEKVKNFIKNNNSLVAPNKKTEPESPSYSLQTQSCPVQSSDSSYSSLYSSNCYSNSTLSSSTYNSSQLSESTFASSTLSDSTFASSQLSESTFARSTVSERYVSFNESKMNTGNFDDSASNQSYNDCNDEETNANNNGNENVSSYEVEDIEVISNDNKEPGKEHICESKSENNTENIKESPKVVPSMLTPNLIPNNDVNNIICNDVIEIINDLTNVTKNVSENVTKNVSENKIRGTISMDKFNSIKTSLSNEKEYSNIIKNNMHTPKINNENNMHTPKINNENNRYASKINNENSYNKENDYKKISKNTISIKPNSIKNESLPTTINKFPELKNTKTSLGFLFFPDNPVIPADIDFFSHTKFVERIATNGKRYITPVEWRSENNFNYSNDIDITDFKVSENLLNHLKWGNNVRLYYCPVNKKIFHIINKDTGIYKHFESNSDETLVSEITLDYIRYIANPVLCKQNNFIGEKYVKKNMNIEW